MYCVHCQREINENDHYCPYCGHKVERCSNCNKPVNPSHHYCMYCGQTIHNEDCVFHYEDSHNEKQIYEDVYEDDYRQVQKNDKVNWVVVIGSIVLLIVASVVSTVYMIRTGDIQFSDSSGQIEVSTQYDTFVTDHILPSTITGNNNMGGKIYNYKDYLYVSYNDQLIRMNYDFKDQQVILDHDVNYINIINDQIYYADNNYRLHVCSLDGSSNKQILNKNVYYVTYNNDYLYYQLDEDNESIYSYNISTEEHKKLNDQQSYDINIVDNNIYYLSADGIYKMDINGNNNTRIIEGNYFNVIYHKDIIYIYSYDNGIMAYDINTDKLELLISNAGLYYNLTDEYLYYIGNDYSVYSYDLRTKEEKCIYNGYADYIYVLDGCVIIETSSLDEEFLIAVNKDGDIQVRITNISNNYI